MSRVLITGGAGPLGAAVARRLLADPAYDVRISDRRSAPLWMREGCEVRDGDLRAPAQALAATKGCTRVVHLATYAPDDPRPDVAPFTLIEHESAIHSSVVRAAVERGVERFVYVSSADVFERAERLPTPEADLRECRAPRSARAFARLAGERCCTAAHEQHDLPYTICRPSAVYGAAWSAGAGEPGADPLIGELLDAALRGERELELDAASGRTRAPTHLDDVADGIVLALGSQAALNDDFNLAGPREVSPGELARIALETAGADASALAPRPGADAAAAPERRWPSAQKAHELLGWQARIALEDGIAAAVRALEANASAIPSAL
ncbi:MAG TPA: NAD(P)-dependent oxidoreductase [Solirubrobacteraceae bacterium]|jgi:nucleoside-diphosphate-sugar epimerase|nr:NAD(P)-dependent oxidoreductase [Solirubrobacteraceae bacterium]